MFYFHTKFRKGHLILSNTLLNLCKNASVFVFRKAFSFELAIEGRGLLATYKIDLQKYSIIQIVSSEKLTIQKHLHTDAHRNNIKTS